MLVALIDLAVTQELDGVDFPTYRPVGMLRFLVLPSRADIVDATASLLFAAAESFWRANAVDLVRAFQVNAGYPTFQAGAGLLPSDWAEHVRLLTANGFHFTERYYCLTCALDPHQPLEETVPQTALSLAIRGAAKERRYQVFFRRTELVAMARWVEADVMHGSIPGTIAYLAEWEVDERWRNQKIGRWLLRRMLNDAGIRGLPAMVVHLPLYHAAAINVLSQHGFVELNYRGYTLEKSLGA
jgi:GNAT superfamily N-acetyltransferase